MRELLQRAGVVVSRVAEAPQEFAHIADDGVVFALGEWWRVLRDAEWLVAVPVTAQVQCRLIEDALASPGAVEPLQVRLAVVHGLPWSAARAAM